MEKSNRQWKSYAQALDSGWVGSGNLAKTYETSWGTEGFLWETVYIFFGNVFSVEKNPPPAFLSLLFLFPHPQPSPLAAGSLVWSQSPDPARTHPTPFTAPWSQCTHTFAPSWLSHWCAPHHCGAILVPCLLPFCCPSSWPSTNLPSSHLGTSMPLSPRLLTLFTINHICHFPWLPGSNVPCFLCTWWPNTSW